MSQFVRNFIVRHPHGSQRILEMMPAVASWNIILFPFWGALIVPEVVAGFVVFFYMYWLVTSLATAGRGWAAHRRIQALEKTNLLPELFELQHFEQLRHLVIIPTYKEPGHILLRTLECLQKQVVGPKRLIPVIAFEERAGAELNDTREELIRDRFADVFEELIFTRHPGNIAGEVVGKSSNMAWAAKCLVDILPKRSHINKDLLTVSSVDADICFHHNHFAELSRQFLKSDSPHRRIWQGALMFYNNIDKIPALMRVFNRICTVVSISGLMRQDGLINFSTYSLSWRLLEKIDFWDVDVIPEDFRIFFKAFFDTHGETRVDPIFLPVYADAAEDKDFWSTYVNTYEQVKRWAWGASDDVYILKRALLDTEIPALKKLGRVAHVMELHFLWPVNWLLMTAGLATVNFFNPSFGLTQFGQIVHEITIWLLVPSSSALFMLLLIDMRSQPNLNKQPLWRRMLYPLELCVLLPFSGFLFMAMPGLDAHTRLFLGKYLEYRVTEKL